MTLNKSTNINGWRSNYIPSRRVNLFDSDEFTPIQIIWVQISNSVTSKLGYISQVN